MLQRAPLTIPLLVLACGSTPTPTPSPTVRTLAVSCNPLTLSEAGQTSTCTANATMSDGSQQNRTSNASWTITPASVATVSATGVVTAVGRGSAQVTATSDGVSGTATVPCNVIAAVIRSVTMSTRTSFAIKGATVVHFDVLGTLGNIVRIDFGDGTMSSSPSGCFPTTCLYFEHTYSDPLGGRTVVVAAIDGSRQQTATTTVGVGDLTGTWANTIVNPTNNLTETRLLVLTGGGSLTGTYVHPAGDSEPVSGSVNSFGSVYLRLSTGSIVMEGVDLDSAGILSDTTMRLYVTGGSADGMVLIFTKR